MWNTDGKYSWGAASHDIFSGKYTVSINKFIPKEHKPRQAVGICAVYLDGFHDADTQIPLPVACYQRIIPHL